MNSSLDSVSITHDVPVPQVVLLPCFTTGIGKSDTVKVSLDIHSNQGLGATWSGYAGPEATSIPGMWPWILTPQDPGTGYTKVCLLPSAEGAV
jgi:hypothetical protein